MTGAICSGANRNLTCPFFLNLSPRFYACTAITDLLRQSPASVACCLKLAEIVAIKQTRISRRRSRPVAVLSCPLIVGIKQECWPFNDVLFLLLLPLLKPKRNQKSFPGKAGGNSRLAWSTNIAWHTEAEVSLQCLVLRNEAVLIHGPSKNNLPYVI